MVLSAPFVLPCYDLRNLVLLDRGTFKDHDSSLSTPILMVGGWKTPDYVNKYFKLLLQHYPKRVRQLLSRVKVIRV